MSQNHDTLREWGHDLDKGKQDDPLLELAARLQKVAAQTATPRPPAEFKGALRQRLLASYQGHWPARLWQGVGSAAAFAVLALVVAAAVFLISHNTNPVTGSQTEPVTVAPADVSPPPQSAPSRPLAARFGEAIELVGYDLLEDTYLPGEQVTLTFYWQTVAQPAEDGMFFVHLYDEDGVLTAQSDEPLDEARPTSSWQPGEIFSNTVSLALPAENLAPGNYELQIGLYSPASGERWVAVQPDGQSTELSLGSITVEPLELLQPNELDHVLVVSVAPESGQVFSGTEPITFEIRVDYELTSMEEAIIQAAVVHEFGNGQGGRGVANAQTTVQQGSGLVVLTAVLYPDREFNAAADLGLLVQMHHAERSAAVASDMPDTYHWRYEP